MKFINILGFSNWFKNRKIQNYMLACLLTSLLVGGVIYIKLNALHKNNIKQQELEFITYTREQARDISILESQVDTLMSRVKHLSMDNSRLTATGNKLFRKLEVGSSSNEEKIAALKRAQNDLATLDQNIIEKYEDYILQQREYEALRHECKNGKIKINKCVNFSAATSEIKALEQQIKFLSNRRGALISQMERSTAGL